MLVVDTALVVVHLSFWHESLRRGQRGWCGLWKLNPLKGQTHFTLLPVPHWSFLSPHLGFTQAAEESEKCHGQGWNSPICALVLRCWMMWSCCHPQSCPEAQPGNKSQPTVWETALQLALDLMGMKECSYWGEEVWMILRLTCDKCIFESS